MNLPEAVVNKIGATLRKQRPEFEAVGLQTRVRFPRLEGLQWRVDVTISSSSLLRFFRPSILMRVRGLALAAMFPESPCCRGAGLRSPPPSRSTPPPPPPFPRGHQHSRLPLTAAGKFGT